MPSFAEHDIVISSPVRTAIEAFNRALKDPPVFALLPRRPRHRPWACVLACGA